MLHTFSLPATDTGLIKIKLEGTSCGAARNCRRWKTVSGTFLPPSQWEQAFGYQQGSEEIPDTFSMLQPS